MAFTRIEHVALIVKSLEDAQKVYAKGLGLSVDQGRTPLPQGGKANYDDLTVLAFPIGEMFIAACKPNNPNSEMGRWLGDRAGGAHHFALASNDIKNDVEALIRKGLKPLGPPTYPKWEGKGPVFFDPATTYGLALEVVPEDNYQPHPYFRGQGLVTGMAHIGIGARSEEEQRHLWEDIFGLKEDPTVRRGNPFPPGHVARAADDPVYLTEYPVGGSVIEISVPADTESGTARFVATRAPLGATIHHICPFSPDVYRAAESAVAAGIQIINQMPPKGTGTGPEAAGVAWFHPRTFMGVLGEMWARKPGQVPFRGNLVLTSEHAFGGKPPRTERAPK